MNRSTTYTNTAAADGRGGRAQAGAQREFQNTKQQTAQASGRTFSNTAGTAEQEAEDRRAAQREYDAAKKQAQDATTDGERQSAIVRLNVAKQQLAQLGVLL
jgi:thiamine biosynthesis lipoprotein ApbE